MATNNGTFRIPKIANEALKNYSPNSPERLLLQEELNKYMDSAYTPPVIPFIINGKECKSNVIKQQIIGCENKRSICSFYLATQNDIEAAIEGAIQAKDCWQRMPFYERAAIFLKAADLLVSPKYRYRMMAATMLGQGKTVWQAEIDCIAELADFWRFNCKFAEQIYDGQPEINSSGIWNRVDYRPLDGFVYAISPFNFTAIGGNLPSAPALMGNTIIWKPSASSIYSNYLIYQILKESGLPDGVIQFCPADPQQATDVVLKDRRFAGLHFTGSSSVFTKIWQKIGQNLQNYMSYPRIVGETGGKNMHFIHNSADIPHAVFSTLRAAFEYQGQKCSACSRLYLPESIQESFIEMLVKETSLIKMGHVSQFENFMSAVINEAAYNKITAYIEHVKASTDAEIIYGGQCKISFISNTVVDSRDQGFFIQPTIVTTRNTSFKTMQEEIFGPVLTIFVYEDGEFEETLEEAEKTSPYALTCGIFGSDRNALAKMSCALRFAAGNLYINDKCTAAAVGQQPFGGSRLSGTNDKAGSYLNLIRWTSPRTIKENFIPLENWAYPSNAPIKQQ